MVRFGSFYRERARYRSRGFCWYDIFHVRYFFMCGGGWLGGFKRGGMLGRRRLGRFLGRFNGHLGGGLRLGGDFFM